ncbi:hypothetical protein AAY473_025210 [Plecturocebus cupreus]
MEKPLSNYLLLESRCETKTAILGSGAGFGSEDAKQSSSVTQAGVQWYDLSSLNLCLLGSRDSHGSASQVAGITETGFHHVGQAGLELLTSGDSPASASESARITESLSTMASLNASTRKLSLISLSHQQGIHFTLFGTNRTDFPLSL